MTERPLAPSTGRHVVVVTAVLPGQGTGSAIVLQRHIDRFLRDGVAVTVVTSEHAGSKRREHAYDLLLVPRRRAWWPPVRANVPFSVDIRNRLAAADVCHRLKGHRPTDVIVLLWGDIASLGPFVADTFSADLHVVIHDQEELWLEGAQARRIHQRNSRILAKARTVLPVEQQQALAYGVPSDRIISLYPIPGDTLYPAPDLFATRERPTLVCPGTVHDWHLGILLALGEALAEAGGELVIVAPADHSVSVQLRAALPSVTLVEPFTLNEDVVRFVSDRATAVLVAYAMDEDSQRWGRTSFPSKLLEFARAGVPPVVICPEATAIGGWAKAHAVPFVWHLLNPAIARDIAARLCNPPEVEAAQRNILALRHNEFDPEAIHAKLAASVVGEKVYQDVSRTGAQRSRKRS